MSAKIFEPLAIKNKTIPNRLLAQAMEGGDCENGGQPSERTVRRYEKFAQGQWGAVVVEACSIVETSLARKNGMIINKKNLGSIKRLADAYKKNNPSGILLIQLTHSGRHSGSFSNVTTLTPEDGKRLLTGDEIENIRDSFIEGIQLAQEAGIDGADIKMCHGYLGAEMLRPSNNRDDRWGGSFENRARFFKEIVQGAKSALKGGDFILGSRISIYEGIRGGCGTKGSDEIVEDLNEMFEVIRLMDDLGMDYVNISAGVPAITGIITRPVETSKFFVLNHLRYTKEVKNILKQERRGIKVIGSAYSTYKSQSPDIAEEMLSRGFVDLCGFGRQTFADPLTPKKLIDGGGDINWCVLCSGCTKLMLANQHDGCIVYDDYYKGLK